MNTYAIYDTKDFECLVAMGNIHEIANYMGTSIGVIRSNMSRKQKLSHRYEVVKLENEKDD